MIFFYKATSLYTLHAAYTTQPYHFLSFRRRVAAAQKSRGIEQARRLRSLATAKSRQQRLGGAQFNTHALVRSFRCPSNISPRRAAAAHSLVQKKPEPVSWKQVDKSIGRRSAHFNENPKKFISARSIRVVCCVVLCSDDENGVLFCLNFFTLFSRVPREIGKIHATSEWK